MRLGVVLALVTGAALIGIQFANTGKKIPEHFSNEPVPPIPRAPKAEALGKVDADSVRRVAELFIDTAVMRKRIDDSWAITTANLHQGLTRAEWRTGNIPVTPYPAKAVREIRYRLDFSGADEVFLKIAILPKRHSGVLGQAFDMGLTRAGPHDEHEWLVDYWVPAGVGVDINGEAAPPAAASGGAGSASSLAVGWIFVPVGIFAALILGIPLAIFGRSWLRGRRALRDYQRSL